MTEITRPVDITKIVWFANSVDIGNIYNAKMWKIQRPLISLSKKLQA